MRIGGPRSDVSGRLGRGQPGDEGRRVQAFQDAGKQIDFVNVAKSEGRFANHFDAEGNPSKTTLRAKQDRLEDWRVLQETGGVDMGLSLSRERLYLRSTDQ